MQSSTSMIDPLVAFLGRFSIRAKLLIVAAITALSLLLVLFNSYSSFQRLLHGFEQVESKANSGVESATVTESNINKVNGNLTSMSADMAKLVTDLQRTNQNVRILERKIKGFAAQQIDIMETLESIAETMEESDQLYEIEDLTDTVVDIEGTIRREGLVGLASTVKEMNDFSASLEQNVNLLRELSGELTLGSAMVSDVVQNNGTIAEQVVGFGHEISDTNSQLLTVLLIVILAVLLMLFLLAAAIIKPLTGAIEVAENISSGDLSRDIKVNSKDEIGQLLSAMQRMQVTLSQVIEEDVQLIVNAAREGDLSQRIDIQGQSGCYKSLCEGINDLVEVSSAVVQDTGTIMAALNRGDLSKTIERTYHGEFNTLKNNANATITKLRTVIEGDIQNLVNLAEQGNLSTRIDVSDKQGFYLSLSQGINTVVSNSENILNDTISVFASMAQGDLSIRITKDYQGSFLNLKNDANDTLDKITQVIEGDIQHIVDAARSGDLSQRISLNGKEGFFFSLSQGINDMVNASDSIVKDTGNVLEALASGDLSKSISNQYHGAFNKLKEDANATVSKLEKVIEQEIQTIVDNARVGNLGLRVNTEDKTGFYLSLSSGINDIVSNSSKVVEDTVLVFSALSNGDLSKTIEREYEGDFARLKNDANATIEKLRAVIEGDIQRIVMSANQGDLSKRIELGNKTGFFQTLSDGINQLVDVSDRIINESATVAKALSEGNLSRSVAGEYKGLFEQLKQDINSSVANMRNIVGEIRFTANNVNNGANEIAGGNRDLSDRTQAQAASLEETNATMRELMDRVTNTASASSYSTSLAQNAKEVATQGGLVVENAVKAMEQIDQSSRKISDIIGVIDEIAFQTNLLALNAAVEAARAGESGRGFSVVAAEVRSLAQRSAQAAKEIKSLIFESGNKVDEGSTLVNKAGHTLKEIVEAVTNVSHSIEAISADAQEQKHGIEQVFQAINDMDSNTQQNAGLVEEITTASASLNEQSTQLTQLVSSFQTETDGETKQSEQDDYRIISKDAVLIDDGDEWQEL